MTSSNTVILGPVPVVDGFSIVLLFLNFIFKMANEQDVFANSGYFMEEAISESDQDTPITTQELDYKVKVIQEKRQASEKKWLGEMEKHARCAMLPSPEKLNKCIGSPPGSDTTDTLRDFELIKAWVTEAQLLNVGFFGTGVERCANKMLGKDVFDSFIQLAFNTAFAAMRNTANPTLPELVFWYYAGHGLSKKRARKMAPSYSATPCLEKVNLDPKYYDGAHGFVKEGRPVQGGELCLHHIGFCDLYGLLRPWIAALKSESINAKGMTKENKHLVIILDSCYSGILAQELNEFKEQAQRQDSTLLEANSVTIQTACGSDEQALGGYFTPCFVYLNDPKNKTLLDKLIAKWESSTDEMRNEYKSIEYPCPMVVTTAGAQPQGSTLILEVQNFQLTLFPDPGFFKFCVFEVHQEQEIDLFKYKDRVLNNTLAEEFMSSPQFTILDYKLKTLSTGPYCATPMGLFLLEDLTNPDLAVCAHIHFKKGDTNKFERINLVRHKKPPMGSILFIEDHDGLSSAQILHNKHKIMAYPNFSTFAEASNLVQACCQYVNDKEPGRWQDVSRWDMKRGQLGANGLFRKRERCAWEDSYLEYIKGFKLEKAPHRNEKT